MSKGVNLGCVGFFNPLKLLLMNAAHFNFTAHNSSCGKVIFSQACVKNSVHGGGGVIPSFLLAITGHMTPWGRHPPGQIPPRQTPTTRQTPPRQTLNWVDTPQADIPWGRHPLGTHPQADTPLWILLDKVNKWVVRILLECILFFSFFAFELYTRPYFYLNI